MTNKLITATTSTFKKMGSMFKKGSNATKKAAGFAFTKMGSVFKMGSNATKKAALFAKMKLNRRNPNKPPRPIYESKNIIQNQKAVLKKFRGNILNGVARKTKKQKKKPVT